jgi:Domain of unknown function (DUF4382)
MRHARTFRWAAAACPTMIFAIVLVSLGLVGCDNACVVFVSNPGGGTISNAPTCSVNPAQGNARLRITSASRAPAEDGRAQIQHIFVTLRGVEAAAIATADEESAGWQELAPKLATEPVQLDLLAVGGDSCEASSFESAAIPADAYRQIRLRLSPNEPEANDPIPQQNSCGSVALNCVVTFGGDIRPLVVDSSLPQIQVSSDHIGGGFFQVLPETSINLAIEFNPQSSRIIPTGEVVRLVPVFTVDSQTRCESIASADR